MSDISNADKNIENETMDFILHCIYRENESHFSA